MPGRVPLRPSRPRGEAATRSSAASILALAILSSSGPAQTRLTTALAGSGFREPVVATVAPGDRDRLFVVEYQTGLVRIVVGGQVRATPFLDLSGRILASAYQGLLGLAFHPDYARNGRFYVNYTRAGDGATIVEEFRVTAHPEVADPASGVVVVGPIQHPFGNHNGGCLQFGPDGYLYVAVGDGGTGPQPPCTSQDGQSLLGKLLRLDVDGPSHIPPSNPFVGDPAVRDEIWALGLRNPWRFSFDRRTGDLWIADVGQGRVEEIDFQPAASVGGENYGWRIMEGTHCNSRGTCGSSVPQCNDPAFRLPIHEYDHTLGCSITGGFVYRGLAVPDLRGSYLHADYCSGRIWALRYDGQAVVALRELSAELAPPGGPLRRIVSFGEDADGELLIVCQGGELWRIVPAGVDPSRDLGFGSAGANGRIPDHAFHGRLDPGATGELRLSAAAAAAPCALLLSDRANPTAIPGIGTVVPFPIVFSVPFATDAAGVVEVPFQSPGSGVLFTAQWAVLDAGATTGIAFSNALEIRAP